MAFQLIYTSVSRGLIPGRSGYTVAARHRQIRERLVSEIERISGYTFAKSGESPVIYAHRKLSMNGEDFHILTRNVDAGSDYTGRTNHLAHHLVCEASEVAGCRATPAEVLHGFRWLDRYEQEPRYFEDSDLVHLGSFADHIKLPAENWKAVRGAAADAALLVGDKGRPESALVAAASGRDEDQRGLLELFGESSKLCGSGADPWSVSFTTYFQNVDNLADFDWAGCTADSPILQRPGRRRVLKLSSLDIPTPEGALAERAENGFEAVAPRPPAPKNVPAPDAARAPSASISVPPPTAVGGAQPATGAAPGKLAPAPPKKKLPMPAVGKARVPVSTTHAAPADDDGERSFFAANWRLVSAIAAVVLVAGGLLINYLANVQPWQRLTNDVEIQLGRGDFSRANEILDRKAGDRSGWRQRIKEYRGSAVLDAMVADVEEGLEELAAEKHARAAMVLRNRLATRVKGLQSFARDYELAEGVKVAEGLESRLRQLELRMPKEVADVDPPGGDPDPPVIPDPDPPGGDPDPPNPTPEAPAAGSKLVYLFLNEGISEISIPQSLPKLARGEQGSKLVTLHHRVLAGAAFPPGAEAIEGGFDFKFPETAEEEDSPMLPRGGGLDVELKFQGSRTLSLVKNDASGSGPAGGVWGSRSSRVIGFADAEERFQIVLWDGRPFELPAGSFELEGEGAVVSPRLTQFVSAISKAEPSSATPVAVMLRYLPSADGGRDPQPVDSPRLELPLADSAELKIDFGAIGERRSAAVATIEKQIEQRRQAVEAAGEYFTWRTELDPLEAGLREMASSVLGAEPDVLIRFRKVLDHADPDRVRMDLRDFVAAILTQFGRQLEELDVPKADRDRIDLELSGLLFADRWDRRELESATAEEFVSFMEMFGRECRSLGKRHVRMVLGEVVSSYYRVDSRTARAQLNTLADAWESQFADESGEALWNFIEMRRPAVPTNLKLIERYQREIPLLMAKKEEAERLAESFAPELGDGLPPGRYGIILEFAEGKMRPLASALVREEAPFE